MKSVLVGGTTIEFKKIDKELINDKTQIKKISILKME